MVFDNTHHRRLVGGSPLRGSPGVHCNDRGDRWNRLLSCIACYITSTPTKVLFSPLGPQAHSDLFPRSPRPGFQGGSGRCWFGTWSGSCRRHQQRDMRLRYCSTRGTRHCGEPLCSRKGCSSRSVALARSIGSRVSMRSRKSFSTGEIWNTDPYDKKKKILPSTSLFNRVNPFTCIYL